ncbi:MAG TPA: universal stress protein, partial [Polyangiaceae bacterium]|nr:universal stress protein [Polyangiaceae bacterium]
RDGTAARLETVLHGLPIRREQIHLRRGVPATEIAKFAAGRRSEAVVMGSVGRSFLGGLLIGEKAEEILNRVDTGVFVLKPEGFVSPIQLQEPSSDRD